MGRMEAAKGWVEAAKGWEEITTFETLASVVYWLTLSPRSSAASVRFPVWDVRRRLFSSQSDFVPVRLLFCKVLSLS